MEILNKSEFNWIWVSFMICLSVSACTQHKTSKITTNSLDSLSKIKDPSVRIVTLDKYIKTTPRNAQLYIMKSKAYHEMGNLDSSIKYADAAINRDTTQTAWYFYMSDLFMEKPAVKSAIMVLERLAISQPTNKEAYLKIGEIQVKSGKFDESEKNLETALKLDRNNAEANFWMGYYFREKQQYDKAIAAFQKAVELKPDYEEAYVILGVLYSNKKDPKALDYYSSAIRLNSHDTAAIYDKGKYYQDIDSFSRAIDEYDKILAMDPNKRDANYGIAYCLYHQKKYNDAIGYFSKVLISNPYDAAAHYGRGLCYKEMGEFEKSRKEINIADGLYAKDKQ